MSKVWRYGDHVDTDVIIPARYLNIADFDELAEHAMEDIDTTFAPNVQPGDYVVAGKNFGCGSSREHAPVVIKVKGVHLDHDHTAFGTCLRRQDFHSLYLDQLGQLFADLLDSCIVSLHGNSHPRKFRILRNADCQTVDIKAAPREHARDPHQNTGLVTHYDR